MKKTPDQIRRETVPVKHSGIIYGFLAAVLGTGLWFGAWGLLHQKQVRRYPEYVASAVRASFGEYSLFGKPHRHAGMTADQLRYALCAMATQTTGLTLRSFGTAGTRGKPPRESGSARTALSSRFIPTRRSWFSSGRSRFRCSPF